MSGYSNGCVTRLSRKMPIPINEWIRFFLPKQLIKVIFYERSSLSRDRFEWVKNDLRLSLSNGIFSKYPLEENIAAVSQMVFENLEFRVKSVKVEDDVSVYDAKRLVDAYGVKSLIVHAATLHIKDEVETPRALYYEKISLELSRHLQASVKVVHSNVTRKLPEARRTGYCCGFSKSYPHTQNAST